jgi:O-antigen ligase
MLRTVGIVGLVPFVWFFVQAWRILYAKFKRGPVEEYSSALLRLGMILIIAFLMAQVTLEFNRPATIDYAQFIFALVGLLVGIADRRQHAVPTGSAELVDTRPTTRRFLGSGPVAS